MATHQVKLKNRREVAEGTMAFHFEKPPGFAFKAGQALAWTLIDPPETDGDFAAFASPIHICKIEPQRKFI